MPKEDQALTLSGGTYTSKDLELLGEVLRADNPIAFEIVDDPAEVSRQIRIQIMEAESDDEAEMTGEAQSWGDLEGIPIEIEGFRVRPSEIDNTRVYFIVFGTRMDDGERVVLTSGSDGVEAHIYNLAKRGKIPGAIRVLERAEKPTKAGFYPHKLTRTAEEREAARQARIAVRNAEPVS